MATLEDINSLREALNKGGGGTSLIHGGDLSEQNGGVFAFTDFVEQGKVIDKLYSFSNCYFNQQQMHINHPGKILLTAKSIELNAPLLTQNASKILTTKNIPYVLCASIRFNMTIISQKLNTSIVRSISAVPAQDPNRLNLLIQFTSSNYASWYKNFLYITPVIDQNYGNVTNESYIAASYKCVTSSGSNLTFEIYVYDTNNGANLKYNDSGINVNVFIPNTEDA